MPGGYASSDGAQKAGTPILAKSNAFQVFILVDTIALAMSSWAVYYHILVVLSKSKLKKVKFYDKAVYLITYICCDINTDCIRHGHICGAGDFQIIFGYFCLHHRHESCVFIFHARLS